MFYILKPCVEAEYPFLQIKTLQQKVRDQISKHNTEYQNLADRHRKQVVYKEGDLVWIHLKNKRFPAGCFWKLKPRVDGPYRVFKKINDHAYKVDLPGHYNISATFNVADLSPFEGGVDALADLMASLFQGEEDDAWASNHNLILADFIPF